MKIGQRDDIYIYSSVAAITQTHDDTMFSQYDFLVYNAVQRFNISHNIRLFLVDMKIAVKEAPEFEVWEREMYPPGESAISRLACKSFEEESLTPEEEARQNFQKKIFQVCDEIGYNKDLSDKLKVGAGAATKDVEEIIRKLFLSKGVQVFRCNFMFHDIGKDYTKVLDIKDLHGDLWGRTE